MRFFRSKPVETTPRFDAPIAPDVPFFAVGDIHGCLDHWARLVEKFVEIAHPSARLICVGDYVDRGEQSAEVLQCLHEMQQSSDGMMTCLMGNHERMMLDFLDAPVKEGKRWLRNGGLQTLASFRVAPVADSASSEAWDKMRDAFRDALGPALESWLRGLPLYWQSGNVLVSHAGVDPHLPLEAQGEKELIWGRSAFHEALRKDGLWVAYGHIIARNPKAEFGRIPLDTGAYATGKLTAALIETGKVRYMST